MGFLKIYCGNCKRTWQSYFRDCNSESASQCPYCGAEIDRQTWNNQIVPAWGMMLDANRELKRDAENRAPLFHVNYLELKGND